MSDELIMFLEFSPPRIEHSVSGSEVLVGRVGQLVVRPGSIIHLDCLQDRRRGNPSWHWSHKHKEYPTGKINFFLSNNSEHFPNFYASPTY